jgi:uncharacterized RDD family membrane protein YckC
MSKYEFQSELNSENLTQEKDQNLKVNNSNYAKWYTRFAAGVVDSLITFIVIFIIILPFSFATSLLDTTSGTLASLFIQLVATVLVYIYYAYFLSKDGATLGLKALGLKTVKEDESLLTFWQAILRTFIFSIIAPINMIMILLTQKKQGAHDMVVNTIVVKNTEKETAGKIITGFCGGCGCLWLIALIIGAVSGSGMLLNSFYMNKNLPNMMQEKKQEMNQNQQKENNFYNNQDTNSDTYFDNEMNEEPSMMEDRTQKNNNMEEEANTNPIIGSEFYKACMQANTNPDIDLSNYCSCAEKEFSKTQDLNEIVNKCKSQIILN